MGKFYLRLFPLVILFLNYQEHPSNVKIVSLPNEGVIHN